jgi:antitoxin Phd
MIIDTNQIITMTDANQNFSKASKTANKYGQAIIIKNNKPKYLLVDLENDNYLELTDDEKIEIVAKRILNKHILAFKELAK